MQAECRPTYEVKPVSELDAAALEEQFGAAPAAGSYAVIRTVSDRLGPKLWSIHNTEALAKAAVRRNKSRDIVTR